MVTAVAALGVAMSVAGAARAQPPFELPWTDQPARYDAAGDRLVVSMVAGAELGVRPLALSRTAAHRRARRRALSALHAFVDAALARIRAKPWYARQVHRAVDRHAEVTGVRPLSDGGVVVRMTVSGGSLRLAAPLGRVPWVP